jgi:hypothetical protein
LSLRIGGHVSPSSGAGGGHGRSSRRTRVAHDNTSRRGWRAPIWAAAIAAVSLLAGAARGDAQPGGTSDALPLVPSAEEADPVLEYGFGMGGQISNGRMSDLAGNGVRFEAHAALYPARSRLGLRVEAAFASTETHDTSTSGTFLWWPVSMTLTTGHTISWIGAGPIWRGPTNRPHGAFYMLLGSAQVAPTSEGGSVDIAETEFAPTSVPFVALGAEARFPLPSHTRMGKNLTFEIGAEILRGGECTFYGNPPFVSDGAGGYTLNTERAPLAMVGLHGALTWSAGYRRPAPIAQ